MIDDTVVADFYCATLKQLTVVVQLAAEQQSLSIGIGISKRIGKFVVFVVLETARFHSLRYFPGILKVISVPQLYKSGNVLPFPSLQGKVFPSVTIM